MTGISLSSSVSEHLPVKMNARRHFQMATLWFMNVKRKARRHFKFQIAALCFLSRQFKMAASFYFYGKIPVNRDARSFPVILRNYFLQCTYCRSLRRCCTYWNKRERGRGDPKCETSLELMYVTLIHHDRKRHCPCTKTSTKKHQRAPSGRFLNRVRCAEKGDRQTRCNILTTERAHPRVAFPNREHFSPTQNRKNASE